MKYLVALICSIVMVIPLTASAHPLDITFTSINLPASGEVAMSLSIHPYEVSALLAVKGVEVVTAEEFYDHQEKIIDYIKSRVTLNIGGRCEYRTFNVPPLDEISMLADGFRVEALLHCPSLSGAIQYTNTLFTESFPLQTNHVDFYYGGKVIHHKVLTKSLTQTLFNSANPGANGPDVDADGITDADERQYGTNVQQPDSDGDGYGDKEEIENSWNPNSATLSPGQEPRTHLLPVIGGAAPVSTIATSSLTTSTSSVSGLATSTSVVMVTTSTMFEASSTPITNHPSEFSPLNDPQVGFGKTYLNRVIALLTTDGWSAKLLLLALAFALGIIHSLEVGQGKSILTTYLLERRARFVDALRFSGFMTATHVVDIVLIAIALQVFSLFTDIYYYANSIEYIGVIALFCAAMYLFIRSIYAYRHPHECDHDHDYRRKGIWLGLIAGIAPCALGWTMLAAAISLGQIKWLVPLIIAFALGIFMSLIIISIVVLITKERILNRFQRLIAVAPIVSASLLLLIALIALWHFLMRIML